MDLQELDAASDEGVGGEKRAREATMTKQMKKATERKNPLLGFSATFEQIMKHHRSIPNQSTVIKVEPNAAQTI